MIGTPIQHDLNWWSPNGITHVVLSLSAGFNSTASASKIEGCRPQDKAKQVPTIVQKCAVSVLEKGMEADTAEISCACACDWPVPDSQECLRYFLGFVCNNRKCISIAAFYRKIKVQALDDTV